jgi:hypothetical protein
MQGIPWQSLPKNFSHAMIVKRAMGLCYIWTNSLCNIQDDKTDWELESAMMANIS